MGGTSMVGRSARSRLVQLLRGAGNDVVGARAAVDTLLGPEGTGVSAYLGAGGRWSSGRCGPWPGR